MPLADGAVDAAFAGEAFHWFATPEALARARARSSRPGGGLALLAPGLRHGGVQQRGAEPDARARGAADAVATALIGCGSSGHDPQGLPGLERGLRGRGRAPSRSPAVLPARAALRTRRPAPHGPHARGRAARGRGRPSCWQCADLEQLAEQGAFLYSENVYAVIASPRSRPENLDTAVLRLVSDHGWPHHQRGGRDHWLVAPDAALPRARRADRAPRARRPATASTAPDELQRLRTLRELLDRFDCGLSDVAFAKRLREDAELRGAVEAWLEAEPAAPGGRRRPTTGCAGSRRSTSSCCRRRRRPTHTETA